MKNISKLIKVAGMTGASALLFAGSVLAADNTGLSAVFPTGGVINSSLDLASIATFVFRILIAAAILWVVYNIVLAGIKIAGAKEDAEKRQEGLKSIVNAAIGLIVALSAYAIVTVVQKQVTGTADATLGLPCTGEDRTVAADVNGNFIVRTGVRQTNGSCVYTDENKIPHVLTQTNK